MGFSYSGERQSGFLTPTFGSTSSNGIELLTPYYINIAPNMDATVGTRILSKRGVELEGPFRYLTESSSGLDNIEYLDNDNETDRNDFTLVLMMKKNLIKNGLPASHIKKCLMTSIFLTCPRAS